MCAKLPQALMKRAARQEFSRIQTRRLARRVLVRARQQAVTRYRENARVRALLCDIERDVDHREPGADEEHARHVSRKRFHPVEIPCIAHGIGRVRHRGGRRRIAKREQNAIRFDHGTIRKRDGGKTTIHAKAGRRCADVLEREPARTPLLREREPIGKVSPYQAPAGSRPPAPPGRALRPFEEIGGTPRERGHPGRGDVQPPVIRARAVGETLAGPRGLDGTIRLPIGREMLPRLPAVNRRIAASVPQKPPPMIAMVERFIGPILRRHGSGVSREAVTERSFRCRIECGSLD